MHWYSRHVGVISLQNYIYMYMKSLFTKNDCRALFSTNNPKHKLFVLGLKLKG